MRCPTCGGDNVDGAKFCGVCGARMTATTVPPVADAAPVGAPRVTAETRQVPQQPPPGASLGESMRVPEAKGARFAKIGIVLAIDAALAIAGVVLMTRGGASGDAAAETGASAGSGAATGSAAGGGGGEGTGSGGGAGGGAGGTTGGGGGGRTHGGGGGGLSGLAGGGGGSGAATGTGAASGTGAATGTGSGSDDDPISAAAAAAAAAAAGKIDAGTGTTVTPIAIDAGITVVPAIDAAPTAEVPVDAAEAVVDAPEAAVSAQQVASHLSRLVVQSQGKMDRCYQNATKALPEDQPLSGEVDIGLAVMPTGAVHNVRVTRNTTGSNDLGNCVQATAAQWTFPAHNESEPIEFMYPFRFGPRSQ